MTDYRHAAIILLVMGIVTIGIRIVPALIFSRGEKVPDYVMYLGNVVPYTAMGLLLVFCLRNTPIFGAPHALPEIISIGVVALSYLWKRNAILSVVIGTVLYMFLVQSVFA